jgi:hypothetical protein
MKSSISPNHQHLIELISKLDNFEAAILKERIWSAAKEIINSQELVREVMKDGLISPDLYINTMQKVYNTLESQHQSLK